MGSQVASRNETQAARAAPMGDRVLDLMVLGQGVHVSEVSTAHIALAVTEVPVCCLRFSVDVVGDLRGKVVATSSAGKSVMVILLLVLEQEVFRVIRCLARGTHLRTLVKVGFHVGSE